MPATSSTQQPRTVLCLGDSHTAGMVGGAWVPGLSRALPGLRFVNAGVNGSLAQYVAATLDHRLARVPPPPYGTTAVTLLVGTNDVMASWYPGFYRNYYRWANRLSGAPTVTESMRHVDAILSRLAAWAAEGAPPSPPAPTTTTTTTTITAAAAAATASASAGAPAEAPLAAPRLLVLLLTIPPIGEQLDHPINADRVAQYNAALAEVVRQHSYGGGAAVLEVVLLDLSAACRAAIQADSSPAVSGGDGGAGGSAGGGGEAAGAAAASAALQRGEERPAVQGQTGTAAPTAAAASAARCGPPSGSVVAAVWNVVSGYARRVLPVWGRSYDAQSRAAGTVVLTPDCVHLNDRGAALVGRLVEAELRRRLC